MSSKHAAGTPPVPETSVLKRRTLFAGAGTLGALAATAAVLPVTPIIPVAVAQAKPADPQGGYQLTEHVERYYQSARV